MLQDFIKDYWKFNTFNSGLKTNARAHSFVQDLPCDDVSKCVKKEAFK